MRNIRNNNGITLIALVITIIVLLILAGVSLSLVIGGNGILSKATNSVAKTNQAKIAEEVELAMAELKTAYYEERYVDKTTEKTFPQYAKEKLSAKDAEGTVVGIATSTGKITLEGNTITYENEKGVSEATGMFDETNGSVTISGTTTDGVDNGSESHEHTYVATELKDCSDEIKEAYSFSVSNATFTGGYVKAQTGMAVGDIVYAPADYDDGDKGVYNRSKGYYNLTTSMGSMYGGTYLGTTYPINVCSCGDHYKAE